MDTDDAFAAAPQGEAGAKPALVLLRIHTAARRFDAGGERLEEGMILLAQRVVGPAPLATLRDEAGFFEKLQLAADVGLRFAQNVHQLADAEAVGRHQQAATDPQAYAVTQRGEGTFNRDHILKVEYVNMGPTRQDPNASKASVRRRVDASRFVCDRGARGSHRAG